MILILLDLYLIKILILFIMKKFLLMFVFVAFSSFMNAQTATTTTTATPKMAVTKTKQVANPASYACVKCFNIEKEAGKCTKCQADKVQLGTYYCEHCAKATGAKPGKCDMCSAKTMQMTRKFCNSKKTKTEKPVVPAKKAA
jgi:hypothetical protein